MPENSDETMDENEKEIARILAEEANALESEFVPAQNNNDVFGV